MDRVDELFSDPVQFSDSTILRTIDNPYDTIRKSIVHQVDEVKWMNDIKKKQESVHDDDISSIASEKYRCIVCTLPIGTCPHTDPWLKQSLHSSVLSSVDTEIDSVLGVLDTSLVIETKPQVADIDLDSIRWSMHNPRMSDKIGDTFLPLSLPPERGWHSLERVGTHVILYGGLRFKDRSSVPQPFTSVIHPDEVEYLSDLYIYDTENLSWHKTKPRTNEDRRSWPCGRYGHCTASIDKYRMLMFGGRAEGGRYLSDTWIFSLVTFSWTPVNVGVGMMAVRPPPRAFAAMAPSRTTRTIVLYGGTDGENVFSDIWIFKWGGRSFDYDTMNGRDVENGGVHPNTASVCDPDGTPDPMSEGSLGGHSKELMWSRDVAVGNAQPPARYGHRLLAIAASPGVNRTHRGSSMGTTKLRNGTFMAVVGGCCVSPMRELAGRESSMGSGVMQPTEIKKLLNMSHELQERYAAEGGSAVIAGREIMERLTEIEVSCGLRGSRLTAVSTLFDLKEVHRRSAAITARMAELEQSTRALESDMAETWYAAQAASMMARNTSSHPSQNIGVHFLCVDDMAWVPQVHPKLSGTFPSSRMHFSAVALGDFIFVMGGVKPTALSFRMVDQGSCVVHALDLKTLVWSEPQPMDSKDYLDGPLRVAEADIKRAKERLGVEKARGVAEGARAGITVEVVEAETILKVCKWRKHMLLKEQHELLNAPLSSWGGAICMMPSAGNTQWEGNRALLHGGWSLRGAYGDVCAQAGTERPVDIRENADVTTDCMMVLDLEQELERRRRLEEEFHAKLERDRKEEESRAFQNKIQSLFELREAARKARERQQDEIRRMEFEDFLSSLPPLSKPKPVMLVKANEHTIWVKWNRSTTNSVGKMLRPGAVTYYLYMAGGFVTYNLSDRVKVTPPTVNKQHEHGKTTDAKADLFARPKDGSESDSEQEDEEDSTVSYNPNQAIKYTPQTIQRVPFHGEIIGIQKGKGMYTVRADDGSIERWHRSCLQLLLIEDINHPTSNSDEMAAKKASKKMTKRQISFQKAQQVAMSLSAANDAARAASGGGRMGKEWKLVYSGENNEYAVERLIPTDALLTEPGITVKVKFCLRTVGVDYPETEYSDKSDAVEFSTVWANIDPESLDSLDNGPVSVMASASSSMSRAKKEIIKVVLQDLKTIELEKWHDFVSGEGVFDSFV